MNKKRESYRRLFLPQCAESRPTFQPQPSRKRALEEKPEQHEAAGEFQELGFTQNPRSSCDGPDQKRPEAAFWTIQGSWEMLQDVISELRNKMLWIM